MNTTFRHLVFALLLFVLASPSASVHAADSDAQLAVLVTGASSGIGRKITEVLAERGYFVYAGARKQKDLDALNEIDNVQAVRLDVTIQQEVDAAVDAVREGGRGLHGLVNNAGVFIGGPVMDVSVDEMRWLYDVNVMGVYRVTQAFAPMIIESQGRITTIGSIAGILGTTFMSQYSGSKHAIEGFTDSLADEMERFGVAVSVVEPGNYNSKITASGFRRMSEKKYAKEGSPFAEDFQKMLARETDRSKYKEPDEVADAVSHALFADEPKRRYLVVPNAQEAEWTIGQVITELVQLNQDQPYEYTRDELIEMLDQAMATTESNP